MQNKMPLLIGFGVLGFLVYVVMKHGKISADAIMSTFTGTPSVGSVPSYAPNYSSGGKPNLSNLAAGPAGLINQAFVNNLNGTKLNILVKGKSVSVNK